MSDGDPFGRGMGPSSLPQVQNHLITERNVRCWRCDKLLAEQITRPWQIKCGRCKSKNVGGQQQNE